MKINNAVVEPVAIKWDDITLPLKEGTPVNIGGNIANNSTAIGLVPVTVYNRPAASDRISILVSGDVDLAEVEKSYGSALETSAKAAMNGIRFHKADGSIDDSADSSYVLPAATASTLGGVKVGSGLSITSGGVLSAEIKVLIINATYDESDYSYTYVSANMRPSEILRPENIPFIALLHYTTDGVANSDTCVISPYWSLHYTAGGEAAVDFDRITAYVAENDTWELDN